MESAKGKKLTQEVNGRDGGSTTNLTRVFQFQCRRKCMVLADLQDAFTAGFEIDVAQDLHKVKATLPRFQTAFVYTRQ
jgi:hypothetical protein